jgi:glycerophosphoryl diester phosphodiesterase
MIIIAHRGNIAGPNPARENHPDYITEAVERGYHVEVDVWYTKTGELFLGHDMPQYEVSPEFLTNDKFFCHAKNIDALNFLVKREINCFSHDKDPVVLTSQGKLWMFPGTKPPADVSNAIFVMPEACSDDDKDWYVKGCYGVCTDFANKVWIGV